MSDRPPQPTYVLRGHATAIHALHIFARNTRLASGDSDGHIVIWNLSTKRPVASWRAHDATILRIATWSSNIVTHGREGALRVWEWGAAVEARGGWRAVLPASLTDDDDDGDGDTSAGRDPWLLHHLGIAGLGFCGAAVLPRREALLVASAAEQHGSIALHSLPGTAAVGEIPAPAPLGTQQAGMLMAVDLLQRGEDVHVLAGYENGQVVCFAEVKGQGQWAQVYTSKVHEQPALSVQACWGGAAFFSSGADQVLAKHSLERGEVVVIKSGHAGQQGLVVRDDDRLLVTAGWDGRARVYSGKTMKELAVLMWAKTGLYAVALARVSVDEEEAEQGTTALVKTTRTVAQAREQRTTDTHWVAVGAKDGKISLWDIY